MNLKKIAFLLAFLFTLTSLRNQILYEPDDPDDPDAVDEIQTVVVKPVKIKGKNLVKKPKDEVGDKPFSKGRPVKKGKPKTRPLTKRAPKKKETTHKSPVRIVKKIKPNNSKPYVYHKPREEKPKVDVKVSWKEKIENMKKQKNFLKKCLFEDEILVVTGFLSKLPLIYKSDLVIQQSSFLKTEFFEWKFLKVKDNKEICNYNIWNEGSKLVLAAIESDDQTPKIIMKKISNSSEENWKLIQNPSESYYKIVNVKSEFCLETDQVNCNDPEKNLLKINKCDQNNLNQRFVIALFNSMVIAEPKVEPLNFKVYCIRAKHSSLSLTTISNIAGEKVIQAKDVKGCPKWNFKPIEGKPDIYFIECDSAKLNMEVLGNKKDPVTPVVLDSFEKIDHQMWKLEKNMDDGSFVIRSMASGMVLDIKENNYNEGGELIVYPLHGGSNQRFFLTEN